MKLTPSHGKNNSLVYDHDTDVPQHYHRHGTVEGKDELDKEGRDKLLNDDESKQISPEEALSLKGFAWSKIRRMRRHILKSVVHITWHHSAK